MRMTFNNRQIPFVGFSNRHFAPVAQNDDISWELRTSMDCINHGLNPEERVIDITETGKMLYRNGLMTREEYQFWINSDRPVTRFLDRCKNLNMKAII